MLKVFGLLAALTIACATVVVAAAGPLDRYSFTWSTMIGREIGGWLFVFLLSVAGASIAAFFTRKRRNDYPGFGTGFIITIAMSIMTWVGRLGPDALKALN